MKVREKHHQVIELCLLGILFVITLSPTAILQAQEKGTSAAYAWTELGPQGLLLARAIVSIDANATPACPQITLENATNSQTVSMLPRASSPPAGFDPILSCELPIPSGTTRVAIAGQALPLLPQQVQRILVIGDTGCRVTTWEQQDCSSAQAWPFQTIATKAAAMHPNLIIHVGDYHYREVQKTTQGITTCALPDCDDWSRWQADFFEPAAPLLPAAPWVFVRGNHENCTRAWRGWFYLLDPRPLPTVPLFSCPTYTDPYHISTGALDFIVMDTSRIPGDYQPTPAPTDVERYAKEYAQVMGLATSSARANWLLTHRPTWAVASWTNSNGIQIGLSDKTLQAALDKHGQALPPNLDLFIGGHLHQFEFLTFTDQSTPQLVVGGSGTKLGPPVAPHDNIAPILQQMQSHSDCFTALHTFSFALLESTSTDWQIKVLDREGQLLKQFPLSDQGALCRSAEAAAQ